MPKELPVEGQGFTMKHNLTVSSASVGVGVEFRPGETSDTARAREGKERNEADERGTESFLDSALKTQDPYSETLHIGADGTFDVSEKSSGRLRLETDTPAHLYELAARIQRKYPKYHFTFETDPEGKWMRCIVSRNK